MTRAKTPWGRGNHGWKKFNRSAAQHRPTPFANDGNANKAIHSLKEEAIEKEIEILNSAACFGEKERWYPKEFTIKKQEAEE